MVMVALVLFAPRFTVMLPDRSGLPALLPLSSIIGGDTGLSWAVIG